MSFDPITYDAVDGLKRNVTAQRRVHYVLTSQTWTAQKNCIVNIRALGAGGGCYLVGGSYSPGNGGTFAFKRVSLLAGHQLLITIGGGAPSFQVQNQNAGGGVAGGVTTVQCADVGLNLSIPGGSPGSAAVLSGSGLRQNPSNTAPTGADWHMACTPAGIAADNNRIDGVAPVVYGLADVGGNAPTLLRGMLRRAGVLSPDSLPLLVFGSAPPDYYDNQLRNGLHFVSLGIVTNVSTSSIHPGRMSSIVGLGAGGVHTENVSGTPSVSYASASGNGLVVLEIFEEEA